jgi:hypothetical protein
MSLKKYEGFGRFLEQKDLNRVAAEGNRRRAGKGRWVVLGKVPAGYLEVESKMRGVIVATAGALEMEVEEFEKAVIRHVAAMKRVGGIQCLDCVLVHPIAYGKAVSRVLKEWIRKNKKRERYLSIPLPPKRNN